MTSRLDTLWYTRCAIPNGFGLAMQRGGLQRRFSSEGIEIRSLKESADAAVRESHFDHTLANSVRYGGSSPALWARSAGRDTRLLGVAVTSGAQLLLTTAESGITDIAQLRGRRFGIPRYANQQIDFLRAHALRGLENALALHGLGVSDVELVDYVVESKYSDDPVHRIPGTQVFGPRRLPGANGEVRGLLRGEVDAIYLHGARGLQLAADLQLRVLTDLGLHADPWIRANNASPVTLTADASLLRQYPRVAAGLLEEILLAEEWAEAHPDEVRVSIAREVNASEFWSWRSYWSETGFGLRTVLDDGPLDALQDFADFLHRWKFIPRRLDVRAWADPQPLRAALAARSPVAATA